MTIGCDRCVETVAIERHLPRMKEVAGPVADKGAKTSAVASNDMHGKVFFLEGMSYGEVIRVDDPRLRITPQPEPTTPRIKKLLSKGLMMPERMTPLEVQELAASIVYHLIMKKKN